MEYVTISDFRNLRRQVEEMRKELRELKDAGIPAVKISKEEHAELDAIEAEMKSGKEKDWREVARSVR